VGFNSAFKGLQCSLILILLKWRIWWAPNNASKWLMGFNSAFKGLQCPLTLILLTWRIWWAPNNAIKWLMGFNSAFKGLQCALTLILLMWRIWWAPNNASSWHVGFNSAFKGLSFADFVTTQDGGKIVSPTYQPSLSPGNTAGTHFCCRLSRPQGHSAIGRILYQWTIHWHQLGSNQWPSDL